VRVPKELSEEQATLLRQAFPEPVVEEPAAAELREEKKE
jgi:hypothetical protein